MESSTFKSSKSKRKILSKMSEIESDTKEEKKMIRPVSEMEFHEELKRKKKKRNDQPRPATLGRPSTPPSIDVMEALSPSLLLSAPDPHVLLSISSSKRR